MTRVLELICVDVNRNECGIEAAAGVEPCNRWTWRSVEVDEPAGDNYSTVGLQNHSTHKIVRSCARVERRVKTTVCVEPADTCSASVGTSEDSSNDDSTVGLDKDVIDPGVKPKDRRETVIKSAIRVETHHASFATMSIVGQNFSIRLNGKRGTAHVHVEASW